MKKAFLCVLLIFMCALLASCGTVDDSGLDDFEQLLDNQSDSSEQTEEDFAEMVYVVIPQGCSAELAAKANELAANITAKTGVTVSVKYDNESTVSGEDNLEILVGNTSRLRSKEILKSFRLGEYIYCWDRGSIILGGRYEEATLDAIDDFTQTVLHGASATSLMGDNVRVEKRLEYDIEEITLNGFDLYDFTIVYSTENKNCEKEVAQTLRDHLAEESGYLLELVPYSERTENMGKIICVGDDLVDDTDRQLYGSFLNTVEQDVLIYGVGSYELSAAAAAFADAILAKSEDGKVSANIAFRSLEVKNEPIKLCSAFYDGERSLDRIYDVSNKIRSGEYDVISFSLMNALNADDIKNQRDNFQYYELALDSGNVFPVLYNASSVSELSCEHKDSLIYVRFKSAVDGKKYTLLYSYSGALEPSAHDGYGIFASDSKNEVSRGEINGFDFVGAKKLDTKTYEKSFYIDTNLLLTSEVTCEKSECAEWTSMFCSISIKAKYCEDFVKLKYAS